MCLMCMRVEDRHLSQPYGKHMWKLQASSSLSVLINVGSGHPRSGMSFSWSTPAVLCAQPVALSVSERHIPVCGVGMHQAQGCGWAPGGIRAQQNIPLPHSGAWLAPTTCLKMGASNSRVSWQVHGNFSTSITDKQWWEEVCALSYGRVVAKHLYILQAGQVCEQRCQRQLTYRHTGPKSSKGSLKAGCRENKLKENGTADKLQQDGAKLFGRSYFKHGNQWSLVKGKFAWRKSCRDVPEVSF